MHKFIVEGNLRKRLKKISKKDKQLHKILMKKMEEVIACEDVNHYKNLRNPLQMFKRVHIKSSFVLTFKYTESEDKIIFYDFDHHDNIYK